MASDQSLGSIQEPGAGAQCAIDRADNPLWLFMLHRYGNKIVADVLLELQAQGHDVIWTLYLIWCDEYQFTSLLSPPSAYCEWRDNKIIPVRAIRMECRDIQHLKRSLLKAELALEQEAVAMLYQVHKSHESNESNKKSELSWGDSQLSDSNPRVAQKKTGYAKTKKWFQQNDVSDDEAHLRTLELLADLFQALDS